ncbi:hypothetical protein PPS11_40880 [Pseudomonas putida S11]|nr:hypothetical protein PPS11_40880 [Pseudomonas putida S11]
MVSEKEISRTEVPARLWQAARTDIYYAYDLTDEGRKYYKADNGLCFGKAQVTAIEQFSEPSEVTGQKMSNVTYAYKITGLPAWAGDDGVKASIAELGKAVASNDTPLKETPGDGADQPGVAVAGEIAVCYTGLFAGSPAPTGAPLVLRAALYLWERACPRRGRYKRLTSTRPAPPATRQTTTP